MVKRVTFLLVVLFLTMGCQRNEPPAPPAPPVVVVDSACLLARDSLTALVREQVALTILAREQMLRYARIVARDPSQTRFIVGWTRRAFAGVIPDSTAR